jgi:hypothetical protein
MLLYRYKGVSLGFTGPTTGSLPFYYSFLPVLFLFIDVFYQVPLVSLALMVQRKIEDRLNFSNQSNQ